MNRRRVLAALGTMSVAGIAGCVSEETDDDGSATRNGDDDPDTADGNGDGQNGEDNDGSEPGASTGTVSQYRTVLHPVDDDRPLEHELDLRSADPHHQDEPVSIAVTITNTAAEPIEFGDRRSVTGRFLYSERFGLFPVDAELGTFDEETQQWFLQEGIAQTDDFQIQTLDVGESLEDELVLLAVGRDGQPLPTPTRRLDFQAPFGAEPVDDAKPIDVPYEWGFSLLEDGLAVDFDIDCPPVESGRDRIVCSHSNEVEEEPIRLEPTVEYTLLDGDTPIEDLRLVLINDSTDALEFNPHTWRIWRYADGDWSELEGGLSVDGAVTVDPDESTDWGLLHPFESIQSDPDVKAGTYAFEIGVPDPAGEGWLGCVAIVTLEELDQD